MAPRHKRQHTNSTDMQPPSKAQKRDKPPPSADKQDTAAPDVLPMNQAVDTLKSWTQTLEGFKNDLTCKICFKVLYEPYTNPCGHTFCYSCLSQWFINPSGGAKYNKTCPDCRGAVLTQPAPAYLIKGFTLKLLPQFPLLNDGVTNEQYEQERGEEASILEADRINGDAQTGGLFKGVFKNALEPRLPYVRDVEDGVDRCPGCTWEIEDDSGMCEHCGYMLDPDYDSDGSLPTSYGDSDAHHDSVMEAELAGAFPDDFDYDDSEELDEELDGDLRDVSDVQDVRERGGPPPIPNGMAQFNPVHGRSHAHRSLHHFSDSDSAAGSGDSMLREGLDDDDSDLDRSIASDDSSLNRFIDDESQFDSEASSEADSDTLPARYDGSGAASDGVGRITSADQTSDDPPSHTTFADSEQPNPGGQVDTDDEDEDEDEDEIQVLPRRNRVVAGASGRRAHRGRPVVIDDDSEDE